MSEGTRHAELIYAAARMALNSFGTDEIVKLANALLDDGVYHDELVEIIDAKPARFDEGRAAFP